MCGDFDGASRAWHEAATKAIRDEHIDIAVQAMSRLAFPVGWSNPARLSSLADKVMTQIDKIDDACKRAEVTIQALGLRESPEVESGRFQQCGLRRYEKS